MECSSEKQITAELSSFSFYHGYIDSVKAVELLKKERPGTFLLRRSRQARHAAAFTISVIKTRTPAKTEIYHFGVLGIPGDYYARKTAHFKSIHELLNYYKHYDYDNHLNILGIRLLYPFDCTESPYAYASSITGRCERLLRHLKYEDEETGEEVCECGMKVKDSQLPLGWTIHQTPGEPKRIFFQHTNNNLTQWDLPKGLWPLLADEKRQFIRERLLTRYPLN